MMPDTRLQLRRDVMQAEGCRLRPYRDTVGKLTIGYGRNLDDVGISSLEAEVMLDHDLFRAEQSCRRMFPWFAALNDRRQAVVVELVFNLGAAGFAKFVSTIAAIERREWGRAAQHLLASKWATQVGPARSARLADALRKG